MLPGTVSNDRKANRIVLAREARRIAEEVENLYIQLEQVGALATIRQYMTVHQEGVPRFDLLQTAKALRSYGGVLLMIASATPRPTIVGRLGLLARRPEPQ